MGGETAFAPGGGRPFTVTQVIFWSPALPSAVTLTQDLHAGISGRAPPGSCTSPSHQPTEGPAETQAAPSWPSWDFSPGPISRACFHGYFAMVTTIQNTGIFPGNKEVDQDSELLITKIQFRWVSANTMGKEGLIGSHVKSLAPDGPRYSNGDAGTRSASSSRLCFPRCWPKSQDPLFTGIS